ncbi:hypothetical protein [Pantanalinema sp. GBBB05]|uniref:hypothetical protein n=1 Tax=Pantanalinema sp. GBBB05 TaxID=2604139 RepID=UPI001D413DAB|nr:hypothetical protein [Pantanalinema sp. GBBB05]
MTRLILPGDPEFYQTLGTTLPPAAPDQVFIVRAGSLILEPASPDEVDDYLQSGEYDQRLAEMGDDDSEAWWE